MQGKLSIEMNQCLPRFCEGENASPLGMGAGARGSADHMDLERRKEKFRNLSISFQGGFLCTKPISESLFFITQRCGLWESGLSQT